MVGLKVRGISKVIGESPILSEHEIQELMEDYGFDLRDVFVLAALTKEQYDTVLEMAYLTEQTDYDRALNDLVKRLRTLTNERAKVHDIAWDIAPIKTLEHLVLIKAIRLVVGNDSKPAAFENIIDAMNYLVKIYERLTKGESDAFSIDSSNSTH